MALHATRAGRAAR